MPAYSLRVCASWRTTCREAETLYAVRKDPEVICPHCQGSGDCQYALSYCLDGYEAEVWIRCPVPDCRTNVRLSSPNENPAEFHRIVRQGKKWGIAKGGTKRSLHFTFAPCKLHFFVGEGDAAPAPPPVPCCAYPKKK